MNKFKNLQFILMAAALTMLAGCTNLYETTQDVQARQALLDLMVIQEAYHQENQKYARNLVQIEKYNLKYHTGIVYLEIESSAAGKYRAISLPAESTTARVFAYDTSRGGFYEMGDDEVSNYVLGSLNHIRQQQRQKNIIDYFSGGLILFLVWLGRRMHRRNKSENVGWVLWPYFLSILPLSLAMATLNHMDKDIVLSSLLKTLMGVALALTLLCIVVSVMSFSKISKSAHYETLASLAVCTVLISIFSATIMVKTYQTYSEPPKQVLYFKPG